MTSISIPINPQWQRASARKERVSPACHHPFPGSLTGPIFRLISALLAMFIAGSLLVWIGHSLINTVDSVGKGYSARLESEL
jgi:hypothetical protein